MLLDCNYEFPGFISYSGAQNCGVRDLYLRQASDVTLLIMPRN